MLVKRMIVTFGFVLLFASAAAQAQNQVSWTYSLDHLFGNKYQYNFTFNNLGPEKDAIFKIQIDNILKDWDSVSFDVPYGWTAKQVGGHIDLQTWNGNLSPYRIWGQDGGPYPGLTSQTFSWTFKTNDPETLTADYFSNNDATVHLQTIDNYWNNECGSYTTNPTDTVVPEPASILAAFSILAPSMLAIRRRRTA